MIRGTVYASSVPGAAASRFWKCIWEASILAGYGSENITLPVRPAHGMEHASEIPEQVTIPRQISADATVSLEEHVLIFIGKWLRKW